MSAACSLPGVLLTQVAAMRALTRQGMDSAATPPVAVAGHSQGVLAIEALRAAGAKDVELLALTQLIGAAATLVARRRGITVLGDRSPMVSVTNADTKRIAALLNEFGKDVRTVGLPLGLMRLHFVNRHRPKSVRKAKQLYARNKLANFDCCTPSRCRCCVSAPTFVLTSISGATRAHQPTGGLSAVSR